MTNLEVDHIAGNGAGWSPYLQRERWTDPWVCRQREMQLGVPKALQLQQGGVAQRRRRERTSLRV
jgi:hypothetical protein